MRISTTLLFVLIALLSSNTSAQSNMPYEFNFNTTSSRLVTGPNNEYVFLGGPLGICSSDNSGAGPRILPFGDGGSVTIFGRSFIFNPCSGLEGTTGVQLAQAGTTNPSDLFNDATVNFAALSSSPRFVVTARLTSNGPEAHQCVVTGDISPNPQFIITSANVVGSKPVGAFSVHCADSIASFSASAQANSSAPTMITGISIVGDSAAPDASLIISDVRPAQVIYSPHFSTTMTPNTFDLVKDKSVSLEITLTGQNLSALPSDSSVVIEARDSNNHLISFSPTIPVAVIRGAIEVNGSYKITASAMQSFKLEQLGNNSIVVRINPLIVNIKTTDKTISLVVHEVVPPKVGAIVIDGGPIMGLPTEAQILDVLNTSSFFSSVYPVPDNSISIVKLDGSISAMQPLSNPKLDKSIALDALNLEVTRIFTGFNRLIGIINPQYLRAHPEVGDAEGIELSMLGKDLSSVFVTDALGVPHELAHIFGAEDHYVENSERHIQYDGTSVDGYDALHHRTYQNATDENIWTIMGPSRTNSVLSDSYWIDDDTYTLLFRNMKTDSDPETILITGTLTNDNEFTFGMSAKIENGVLSPSNAAGDIEIVAADGAGKTVSSVKLASDFTARLRYKLGSLAGPATIQLNAIPVIVQMPYDPSISSLQILRNGKVLKKTSLVSQSLQGIVEAIPDSAFRIPKNCFFGCKSSAQVIAKDRQILNELMSKAQKLINNKQNLAAILAIDVMILEIKLLTYDDYVTNDPTKLNQSEIISQLKEIIGQLKSNTKFCAQKLNGRKYDFLLKRLCK